MGYTKGVHIDRVNSYLNFQVDFIKDFPNSLNNIEKMALQNFPDRTIACPRSGSHTIEDVMQKNMNY